MESKILALPLSSGILFVGITIAPSSPESPSIYNVWIGCHRDFDELLMDSVVRMVLREELQGGVRLVVQAHRGISRSPVAKVVDTPS